MVGQYNTVNHNTTNLKDNIRHKQQLVLLLFLQCFGNKHANDSIGLTFY